MKKLSLIDRWATDISLISLLQPTAIIVSGISTTVLLEKSTELFDRLKL